LRISMALRRQLLVCTAFLSLCAATVGAAEAKNQPGKTASGKTVQWYPTWLQAAGEARKADKLVLAYCCGSDWDEWTQKLDVEVLNTDAFREWATKNVILFKCDYLKYKSGGPQAKELQEKFKIKYN